MSVARIEQDAFQRMLVWSLLLHGVLFTAMALAARLGPSRNLLPPPVGEFINISLGQSGPLAGAGGGGEPAPAPRPEPEPTPPPPEEPEEKAPSVVRPTREVRDEIPAPEAPVAREAPEPRPDSGLRGADAASAESAPLAQPGQPGPPGLGLGGAGGGSPFDQDFEYAYYVRQMLAKIHQHWQRTAVRGTAIVIIRFTILRDGSLENPEVEASSGIAILDRSSLRAVMLADPLPPLPNSYPRDSVGVHLRFTYSDQP